MRLLWLPSVLRAAGLTVVEVDGWEKAGADLKAVDGIVCHHTATRASASDAAVEQILRSGRADLAGPLCQLGLRRSGTWVVVAAGKANHNGYGSWGNQSLGIEAYNDGVGEEWNPTQYKSFVVGVAALRAHLKLPLDRVKGHKETDPKRKIDPTFSMADFRDAVARVEQSQSPVIKSRRKRMYLFTIKGGDGKVWATDGFVRRWIRTPRQLEHFKAHFAPSLEGRDVVVLGDNDDSRDFLAGLKDLG